MISGPLILLIVSEEMCGGGTRVVAIKRDLEIGSAQHITRNFLGVERILSPEHVSVYQYLTA